MKRTIMILTLLGAALAVSACATVTRGSTEDVQFLSTPPGAVVKTTNGYNCQTPCTIKIDRRDTFTATFTLNGENRQVFVDTEVAGEGVAAGAGNILIGGIIGAGVDVATGAGLDHTPNPVIGDFTQPQGALPVDAEAPEDKPTS